MFRFEDFNQVLIVAPHADDDVLGCGGLAARLRDTNAEVHVIYAAVDGFHHYGVGGVHTTTLEERLAEIEAVADLYEWSTEILYAGEDLIEQLDTVPRRDLVDSFENALNTHRPDVLLLPCGVDYDQDHVAVFSAAHAAARPIAPAFGKHLVPHVLTYEATKLNWNPGPLPDPVAFVQLEEEHLETKIEGLRRYATQWRPSPHIRSEESVRALAELRGKEIGTRYAEAYAVARTIL